VRSAGTGNWHVGEPADARAQLHARRRGYDLSDLSARQVLPAEIAESDIILAMDRENLQSLLRMCRAEDRARIRLFLDFAPKQPLREVPDPYYGGEAGFEQVLNLCEEASRGLLEHLSQQLGVLPDAP
jgi:protein-tyrosine phosphatase